MSDGMVFPQEEMTSMYSDTPNTMIGGGITKREYFSALAMQGLLSFGGLADSSICVEISVRMADLLIKELDKKIN